jgi:molybdate transport system substrate-binding protein
MRQVGGRGRRGAGRGLPLGRFVAGLTLLAVVAGACEAGTAVAPSQTASPNPSGGTVRIAAASSTRAMLTAVKSAYEAATPGAHLTLTFGASQTLQTQVQQGGFDVFVSDGLEAAQAIVANRHGAGPAQVFAMDQLVVAVPVANPAGIRAATALSTKGVRIAGIAAGTPLAKVTDVVVQQIAGLPAAGSGYAAAVAANTKIVGDDPPALITALEQGTADAAIVYASDLVGAKFTTLVTLPSELAKGALQQFAVVVIAEAGDPTAASAFVRWLTTDAGPTLRDYGFMSAGGNA